MLISSQLPQFIGANFYTDPRVCTYHNAIYVGGTGYFDNQHGVFSQEGHIITASAFFHKYPSETKDQPLSINPNTAKNYPIIEEAYFAGHFHDQYGHFLTEFISRIWAYKKYNLKLPILVRTAHSSLRSLTSTPWAKDLLDLLDLKISDFIAPITPIRIKKLTIPDPLFAEQGYCYKHMADFCHTLGDKAMSTLSEESLIKNSNIYLSRSKLVAGTVKLDNEQELEKELQELGFVIIHPQDYPVRQQISFFRNNNIVIGAVGSAFHTSIFSSSPKGVAINMKEYPDVNFLTMDGVNNASIDYIIHSDILQSSLQNANYGSIKTIKDPKAFARDLCNFVIEKRAFFAIANMGKIAITYKPNIIFQRIKYDSGQGENVVKVDSRSGLITTSIASSFNDLLLVTLKIKNEFDQNFLMVNSNQPSVIQQNQMAALIFPVDICEIDGKVSIYIKNLDQYFTITNNNSRSNFETYTLANFDHKIESKEGLILLCSILSSVLDTNSYSNMEYYNYVYPDIVNSIFDLKNSLHRYTKITYDSYNSGSICLSNKKTTEILTGKTIVHRTGLGDIVTKGFIDVGQSFTNYIEAITIKLDQQSEKYIIKYAAHIKDSEWTEWVNENETAGTMGQFKPLIGFSAKIFDQYNNEVPCICYAKFVNDETIHSYKGGVLFSSPDKENLIGFAVYLE